jgi:DNA-binding response OmpR family regulator
MRAASGDRRPGDGIAMPHAGSDAHRFSLTRKEHELLRVLESQPGRCFSRAYLLSNVWGYNDGARTRTVDVHISRLRKKLEDLDGVEIHAIVGRGYMLQRRHDWRRAG